MSVNLKLVRNLCGLFLLWGVIYVLHRYVIWPQFESVSLNFINFSYRFNGIATLMVILTSALIGLFSKDFLGFLFMVFGALKIVLFILIAQKAGFDLGKNLVLHFFIPYAVGVGLEIYFLTRQLKDDKSTNIKDLD